MARVAGVDIPNDKSVGVALTYVYGIGRTLALQILGAVGVLPSLKVKDVPEDKLALVREYIEKNCKVEGDLRKEVGFSIKRLKEIGSWRGKRHILGLPARGQTTRTNSRTRRGNMRKTMTSGRRKIEKT